jgi:serine protease Do
MKGLCALAIGLAVLATSVPDGSARGIKDLEEEMIGLVDGVSESIVSVTAHSGQTRVSGDDRHVDLQARARSVGCGVVYEEGGLILTTATVVGYATEVDVSTRDGSHYAGTVVGVDPASDLAVVRADTDRLKPARFADDVRLLPGSVILVLGNAFGSLPSVSMGMVSNITPGGQEEGSGSMFGLSVAINPGDIGGPVVNTDGEVIGLVIGRLTFQSQPQVIRTGGRLIMGGGLQHSNMSIAMPAARALGIATEILEKGSNKRGFLGVTVVNITDGMRAELGQPGISGVMVMDVVPGSPAESIGIATGDVITGFASHDVANTSDLGEAVKSTRPGDVVAISFNRGGSALSDGVRVGWMVPEYIRQAAYPRVTLRPEQVRARIDDLKQEVEVLEAELENLEKKD